jgi:tetratricopeptide (TPR) repeat protein
LHLGDYGEARAHFEMAADIAREVGDPRFESWWLGNLGRVALESGDYDKARGHLATALQLAREIDEHRYESQWATALATVAIEQHEHAKACGWLQRALEIGREIGPIGGPVLDTCSSLAAEAGEFEEAALLLAAAEVHGHRSRAVWETARHDSTRTTCEGHLEASTFRAATQRGESLDWQSAVDTGSLVLRSLG